MVAAAGQRSLLAVSRRFTCKVACNARHIAAAFHAADCVGLISM